MLEIREQIYQFIKSNSGCLRNQLLENFQSISEHVLRDNLIRLEIDGKISVIRGGNKPNRYKDSRQDCGIIKTLHRGRKINSVFDFA